MLQELAQAILREIDEPTAPVCITEGFCSVANRKGRLSFITNDTPNHHIRLRAMFFVYPHDQAYHTEIGCAPDPPELLADLADPNSIPQILDYAKQWRDRCTLLRY
jgi:hypothetical protein